MVARKVKHISLFYFFMVFGVFIETLLWCNVKGQNATPNYNCSWYFGREKKKAWDTISYSFYTKTILLKDIVPVLHVPILNFKVSIEVINILV